MMSSFKHNQDLFKLDPIISDDGKIIIMAGDASIYPLSIYQQKKQNNPSNNTKNQILE